MCTMAVGIQMDVRVEILDATVIVTVPDVLQKVATHVREAILVGNIFLVILSVTPAVIRAVTVLIA